MTPFALSRKISNLDYLFKIKNFYRNDWAKLKSCGHPRIKLKKCFVVRRPKRFIENCDKNINS